MIFATLHINTIIAIIVHKMIAKFLQMFNAKKIKIYYFPPDKKTLKKFDNWQSI